MIKTSLIALVALLTTANGYHLIKKVVVLPGDGIWDYVTVDTENRRVYCSHGEETIVLDADGGSLLTRIPAPKVDPAKGMAAAHRTTPFMGVHHVAIANDLNRGFISNGRASSATIFDLKTFKKLMDVPLTGTDPNAIVYDASTHRVFAFNEASDTATVFDAGNGRIITTIALGGKPAFAASDDKGHVFVNLMDKAVVLRIDSRTLKPGERWTVAPCEGPFNETMAIDKAHDRLFVGCRPEGWQQPALPGSGRNRVMAVLDSTDGHLVATAPIGSNPDQAAFDPGTSLIFSSNGDGTITVIKQQTPDEYRVSQVVATEPGANRMAVDPKTHNLFVPNADLGPMPAASNPLHPQFRPVHNFRVLILGSS
jgi:hypothetical protein